MASSVPRSRLLALEKVRDHSSTTSSASHVWLTTHQLRTTIFSHVFNPSRARLGTRILHQRLRGPTLAAYYPRKSASVSDVLKEFKRRFNLDGWNEDEEDRLESIEIAKMRGKGAPKKIREKSDGKKGKKKKK